MILTKNERCENFLLSIIYEPRSIAIGAKIYISRWYFCNPLNQWIAENA
jgi:hypothetical protein